MYEINLCFSLQLNWFISTGSLTSSDGQRRQACCHCQPHRAVTDVRWRLSIWNCLVAILKQAIVVCYDHFSFLDTPLAKTLWEWHEGSQIKTLVLVLSSIFTWWIVWVSRCGLGVMSGVFHNVIQWGSTRKTRLITRRHLSIAQIWNPSSNSFLWSVSGFWYKWQAVNRILHPA